MQRKASKAPTVHKAGAEVTAQLSLLGCLHQAKTEMSAFWTSREPKSQAAGKCSDGEWLVWHSHFTSAFLPADHLSHKGKLKGGKIHLSQAQNALFFPLLSPHPSAASVHPASTLLPHAFPHIACLNGKL